MELCGCLEKSMWHLALEGADRARWPSFSDRVLHLFYVVRNDKGLLDKSKTDTHDLRVEQ